MEQIVQEKTIALFGDTLPKMSEIMELCQIVHSSEAGELAFARQIEENMDTNPASVGIGLFILGKYDQALEKLKKAKDCKEKYIFSAFALRKNGDTEQAIENLQKSLDYDADSFTINLEKAETYRLAHDFESAAQQLKKCTNFENVSADYHYQFARLQETQGLYTEAVGNYKTALELAPEHQKALFHLAYRCDLMGDEYAAIDYYKQIVSTAPVYVNALLNLAVLYEDLEKYEKASMCIDKVLAHFPNHQRARLFKKDVESSKTMFYDEEQEKRLDRKTQILETPISDFELSVRSRNCFKKMNVLTLGDLCNISESELLSYKNFGETSLKEIKQILESKGLHIGFLQEGDNVSEDDTLQGDGEETPEYDGLLSKSVDDLRLSVRARKCLQKLDLRILDDVTQKTEAELLGCKNFGMTSLNEIKQALNDIGLSLRKLD